MATEASEVEKTKAHDLVDDYLGEASNEVSDGIKEVMYQAVLFVVVTEGLAD